MENATIKTNGHRRDLVMFDQLPAAAQKDFEHYVTGENRCSLRFVEYRGSWYDTKDCDGLAADVGLKGWDLYASDSAFSGVLFRWPLQWDGVTVDYDSVVVGTYYC